MTPRIYTMQQGSPEWHEIRRGIVTASGMKRIITPAKLAYSSQAQAYIDELLAERFTEPASGEDGPLTYFMHRGNDLEPTARAHYAFTHRVDVQEVGFVMRDDGKVGCSPDSLVDEDGGLEIKCPDGKKHVENLRSMREGIGAEYRLQVQTCIMVCERDWWDELSFHPDMPASERRTPRDDAVIVKISEALERFLADLQAAHDECVKLGCTEYPRIIDAGACRNGER